MTVLLAMASATLILTGSAKLANAEPLARAITALASRTRSAALRLARALGVAEVGAGTFTLFKTTRPVGTALIVVPGAMFVVAGVVSRLSGVNVECGCFGSLYPHARLGVLNLGLGAAIVVAGLLAITSEGSMSDGAGLHVGTLSLTLLVGGTAAFLKTYKRPHRLWKLLEHSLAKGT